MKVTGTQLDTSVGLVKARSGAYGDGKFVIDSKAGKVLIGGLQFPVAPMNKFTPEPDGMIKILDGKLAFSLFNEYYTLNTISFETVADPSQAQQASYTIQQGQRSIILNNLSSQTATMLYDTGTPVTITAINYSTGAVTTRTLNPTPGQAYRITSNSTSQVVGELRTTGGELVSGGELKNICLRYGIDPQTVQTVFSNGNINQSTSLTKHTALPDNEQATINAAQERLYFNYFLGAADNGATINQLTSVLETMFNNPIKLCNHTPGDIGAGLLNAISNGMRIYPGQLFVVPTGLPPSNFFIVIDRGGTILDLQNFPIILSPGGPGARFALTGGEEYMLNLNLTLQSPTAQLGQADKEARLVIRQSVKGQATLSGPYKETCLQQGVIDTRYSYTTPVITTDTRRTIYSISITVDNLN